MKIDFEKYRVEFPKKPKIPKLKRPNKKYYSKIMRGVRKEGLRR